MFSLWTNGEQVRSGFRHASTARATALLLSREEGHIIEICTIEPNGTRKVRTVIHPDGRAAAPAGAETGREGCVAHTGARCFCTPCRAERKAARS